MNTRSRREFFTYAAAATLASALPVSAQTKRGKTQRPLVVDMIGPMAFQCRGSSFDAWMPHLDATGGNRHEAGIMTPLMGFALPGGNYRISETQGSLGKCPTPHPTGGGQIYQTGTSDAPTDYYIHISLPMPFNIVLLHPTPAKIWSSGPKPPGQTSYAVGLRLLYAEAGAPKISMFDGTHLPIGVPADGVIRFDPDPAEVQLDMSIDYSPSNADDPSDATNSFKALAKLLNLDLHIELDEPHQDFTRYRPCKSPVMQLKDVPMAG